MYSFIHLCSGGELRFHHDDVEEASRTVNLFIHLFIAGSFAGTADSANGALGPFGTQHSPALRTGAPALFRPKNYK